MFPLEGIGEEVAQFTKGCERLLSALARHTEFSDAEKKMIAYYCEEIMSQTQALRDKLGRK